jgi:hypothetical protein
LHIADIDYRTKDISFYFIYESIERSGDRQATGNFRLGLHEIEEQKIALKSRAVRRLQVLAISPWCHFLSCRPPVTVGCEQTDHKEGRPSAVFFPRSEIWFRQATVVLLATDRCAAVDEELYFPSNLEEKSRLSLYIGHKQDFTFL